MSNDPAAEIRRLDALTAGPRRGLLFVLSSPSGAGKTTLSKRLREAASLEMSVSWTTRAPRPGEIDGVDYHFRSHDAFRAGVAAGDFLEHAEVFGNLYGTPRAAAEAHLTAGRDVLFDIDWQGARQMRAAAAADIVSVFVLPPSIAALRARLEARGQDSAEVIARRMRDARAEISHWAEYDYVIVNDDMDRASGQLEAILCAERLRRDRRPGLAAMVAAFDTEEAL